MRQGHIIVRGENNIGMEQCHYNEAGTHHSEREEQYRDGTMPLQ